MSGMEGSTSTFSWAGIETNQTVGGAQPEVFAFEFKRPLDQPVEPVPMEGVGGEGKGHWLPFSETQTTFPSRMPMGFS